ncbi:MAG: hypothetical protein BGO69_11175 [Bacteroidetes bacterium 46-16]|nr:MAG: hypothetical protein BGO69_11175 [Bacteroidetes bacterium 46-16]
MKQVYCLSGLGADRRIFQKLELKDTELVHIPWVPVDRHDEIACYAQKMSAQIPGDDPVILGVSFGGMLAVEIAKLRKTKKIFIVSSAKTKEEIAGSGGGFLQFLVKYNMLPAGLMKIPNSIMFRKFGAETDDEKALLTSILKDTDTHFVKWAFKAMQIWENTTYDPAITHIHGTDDHIILPEHVSPNYWIQGGTHLMIYNKAEEIAGIINTYL